MKPCTLLVVDDDVDDHELISQVVATIHTNCRIIFAINGLQALSLLADKTIAIDIILLDLNMPVMNGVEFLQIRKEQALQQQLPVFVHSTTIDPFMESMLKDLGVCEILSKGISIEELKANLQKVFDACVQQS